MPRPQLPSWATDPTFNAAAGIDPLAVGQPVRVAPSVGQRAQGDVPGLGYVSEHHNWLLGLICDNLAWVTGLIDVGGDFNYEVAQLKRNVYPLSGNHTWNPYAAGDWVRYDGVRTSSTVNDACLIVALRGIPAGARVETINVRYKTANGAVGRGPHARMEVIRYRYSALVDLTNPLSYDTGPNPGWEVFTNGFPGPGPYVLDFPHLSLEGWAGTNQPFFIQTGYEYAVRIWSGTDAGPHQPDEFMGVFVDWTDVGPRSGG